MKKLTAILLILGFLISGCSFDVQMVTTVPVGTDQALPTSDLITPIISTSTAIPADEATPPSLPADAFFHDAFFTLDAINGAGQWTFPAGSKQVFAIWEYQNMQVGMMVKREWLLNGKPWLTREEPWDFAKYGSSGTMRDISIYDNDLGLPSGAYQLTLYVNNIQQPIGMNLDGSSKTWTSFEILPAKSVPEVYSPDAQWDATVLDGKTLIMRDASKRPSVLYNGREILHLTWLPDNQHVLLADRDRSGQK